MLSVSRLLRLSVESDGEGTGTRDLLWLAARMYMCHSTLSAGVTLYQVRALHYVCVCT